jgi:quercetin dioxygenase-like cupin family protein
MCASLCASCLRPLNALFRGSPVKITASDYAETMARTGERLENPVTRERIVWKQTAADTQGELLEFDFFMAPGGFVAAEHLHPKQEERFDIVRGRPFFRIAGDERRGSPGDRIVVPPGVPHVWSNPGDDEVHAVIAFRSALRMESFFETFFGYAQAGQVNERGLPNPLRLAVLGANYSDEVRLARIPFALQRAGLAIVAAVGRRLGYRA